MSLFASIRLTPLLPAWLLLALAALCVLTAALTIWRGARGGWWRLAAFSALLLWLAGPRLIREERQALPDIGVLLVDESESMRVGARATVAAAARARLEAAAREFPDLELRTVAVPPGGDGTRLFDALGRALADIPPDRLAGTIAVTDGMVHDAPATAPDTPLNVLLTASGEQTDRRIRVIDAPSYGIVGRSVTLHVAVDDLGGVPAPAAVLTTRRDGEAPTRETVPIGADHAIEVPIDKPGPTVVTLTAEPRQNKEGLGEASLLNNTAAVTINGVRDRLRILLISGEPNPAERMWRRLLKSDPAVDLVHFTILRSPDRDDTTPLNELALIAFPIRELFEVKLREFDLIILDRFQNRGLLPQAYLHNIADYVREGGALLMETGPEYAGSTSLADTPLGDILPARADAADAVTVGAFRPAPTPLGKRHPVTDALTGVAAWGPWYRHLRPDEVRGETLLAAGGDPLLVLDHVGQGRVAMLLSDQIWLWARGHEGGGPDAELLRRAAHWAMREPDLEEEALEATVADGTLRVARRTLAEQAGRNVSVLDPAGHVGRLALRGDGPGRASGTTDAAMPGVWQVTDGELVAYAVSASQNAREMADLRATATVMRPLAEGSRGGVHWLGDAPDSVAVPALRRVSAGGVASGPGWVGLARRHAFLVTGRSETPLLPAWVALPALGLLLAGAWWREGT